MFAGLIVSRLINGICCEFSPEGVLVSLLVNTTVDALSVSLAASHRPRPGAEASWKRSLCTPINLQCCPLFLFL